MVNIPIWHLVTMGTVGAASVAAFVAWIMQPTLAPPRQYLDHAPKDSLLTPLGLICHAHSASANLQPVSPEPPVTLFSLLELDYTKAPFHPPDACAYPYQRNYGAARRAVTDAWVRATDKYDSHGREWRDLFAAAGMVLLNDTTRIVYVKEVLPEIEAKGEAGWRELCDEL